MTGRHIRATHGRLDIVVNNAGMVIVETPGECTLESFRLQNSVMNEGVTSAVLGLENTADLSPVGLGEPQDVANVVLFLASDESRFVNGTEIIIDNAMSIQ